MAKMTDEEIAKGLEANKKIYNRYIDMKYQEGFIGQALRPLIDSYFRVKKVGFDQPEPRNNPEKPVILIANHSGMAFPWDGVAIMASISRDLGFQQKGLPRPLVAPQLTAIKVMNPFMLERLWQRCGGINASFFNFETMMQYQDGNILIFPEGINGIGKGFDKKYNLQRFATSFVRMALKHETDVVPVFSINGEYINPYSYSSKLINKVSQIIGIPYIPMGLTTLLLPFCPWMFYFGLPANLTFVKGKRISPSEFVDKPYDELSEAEIKAVRDKIATAMQQDLDQKVIEYGQNPYDWKSFFQKIRENGKQYNILLFPFGWPLLFAEFERQWKRYEKTGQEVDLQFNMWSPLTFLFRNPLTILYYIPILGWLYLFIKGYSKQRK